MKESVKDFNRDMLYTAVLGLESREECAAFFSDLCTDVEIAAISQRLAVAVMIEEGKKYDEIEQLTGASPATISRVKRSMKNYREYGILDRIRGDV